MKLALSMTLPQFDHGYWYATELKAFAKSLGIPSAGKLRKDELEKAIRLFLETGKIESPTRTNLPTSGTKDAERGLKVSLPVAVYTNDPETKAFLEREAQIIAPGLKRKSGARYRLNRWREEQLLKGEKITYVDLVEEYVRLNQLKEPFQQIPHGRYINFVSDFFAAEKAATREQVTQAWEELKKLDIPKNYRAWLKWRETE